MFHRSQQLEREEAIDSSTSLLFKFLGSNRLFCAAIMSDSSLSGAALDDNVLEEELRQVVRNIYKAGNLDELTVKRVRCAAETSLALSDGFYKEPAWKERSKAIIESEAVREPSPPRAVLRLRLTRYSRRALRRLLEANRRQYGPRRAR